jgi:hypothetical protein
MRLVLVPLMLIASSSMMALAWLGHLRFKEYGFLIALGMSWLIVLPEYILNVSATRWGHGLYTGAQMASFHLCAGVLAVALVSRFYLSEPMATPQIAGFVLMGAGIILVVYKW